MGKLFSGWPKSLSVYMTGDTDVLNKPHNNYKYYCKNYLTISYFSKQAISGQTNSN